MSRRRLRLIVLPAGLSAALIIAVLGLAMPGALRISLIQDVTALLPDRSASGASLVELSRRWGMMRKVAVAVGPGEPDQDDVHRAVDDLATALGQVEGVARVMSRVDVGEMKRATELIRSRAARLYRPRRAPLGRVEILERLSNLKRRLASPEALLMQDYLLSDPLGFGYGALQGLEAAGQALGAVVDRGRLMSADRRYALAIADLEFDPFEVDRAEAFVADLDLAIQRSGAKAGTKRIGATALGGVHYAASSASVIMADVTQAFVLTTFCVIAIFFVFFRRIRLLAAVILPGGVGIAAGLGVMGFVEAELHALTIGFAATITGISVDYAIHLFLRALAVEGATTAVRMRTALELVFRPVLLGGMTTVAAFVLIAFSDFTGIRQLALFAAVSVPVALAVTLGCLPAFHSVLLGGGGVQGRVAANSERLVSWLGTNRSSPRRRAVVLVLFAAAAGCGLLSGSRVTISGDPRDMAPVDDDLETRRQLLSGLFPGLMDQALVVATAKTVQEALSANDALYERLVDRGVDPARIISVSPILPSLSTQKKGLAAAAELLGKGGSDLWPLFEEAGFSPGYYRGLGKMLEVLPIEVASYEDTSLSRVLSEAILYWNDRWHVLTRVRAGDDEAVDEIAGVAGSVPGCSVVSERLAARAALGALQKELVWMLMIWIAVSLPLLCIIERSIGFGPRAVLPALLGVISAVGLFGFTGRPLTPVASAGITLVMGLGIDYGIFMQSRVGARGSPPAMGVVASALTTIAAFGVLALARVRAIADLGLIVAVGVSTALVCALLLLPLISPSTGSKGSTG